MFFTQTENFFFEKFVVCFVSFLKIFTWIFASAKEINMQSKPTTPLLDDKCGKLAIHGKPIQTMIQNIKKKRAQLQKINTINMFN